jgi:hypothetical protein
MFVVIVELENAANMLIRLLSMVGLVPCAVSLYGVESAGVLYVNGATLRKVIFLVVKLTTARSAGLS